MKFYLLLALCYVWYWSDEARADVDNEVKRGVYPFMAILYYTDDSIVDSNGIRFQRGAVLIKLNWLLSSAIDHTVADGVPVGFPTKTLLAKAGASTLDSNFTLNEDEDEQEREIVQLVRPNINNPDTWWFTDISLLKTLLPFKETSAVSPKPIVEKPLSDRNCFTLVYAKKYNNGSDEKNLMQLTVELLPPTLDNCGSRFSDSTMTCGVDTEETKNTFYDPDFCQGNSGSPLICESEIAGVQTYIENNCKAPHLFQLLGSWHTFIGCGTAEKCLETHCNVCQAIHKDKQITEEVTDTTESLDSTTHAESTTSAPIMETIYRESESTTISDETEAPTTIETSSLSSDNVTMPDTTEPESETLTNTLRDTTTTHETISTQKYKNTTVSEQTRSWPVERAKNDSKTNDLAEVITRKTKLEAQLQPQVKVASRRSSGERGTISRVNVLIISLCGITCLF